MCHLLTGTVPIDYLLIRFSLDSAPFLSCCCFVCIFWFLYYFGVLFCVFVSIYRLYLFCWNKILKNPIYYTRLYKYFILYAYDDDIQKSKLCFLIFYSVFVIGMQLLGVKQSTPPFRKCWHMFYWPYWSFKHITFICYYFLVN